MGKSIQTIIRNVLVVFLFIYIMPVQIHADAILSNNQAKSTSWVTLFLKKDQTQLQKLIVDLDKTRAAMIQDTQTSREALSVYGDKLRLLEALLDKYKGNEPALIKAEVWLELPPLSEADAIKELDRLRILYWNEGRSFADFQYGHRNGKDFVSYAKQEEKLLQTGKTLSDFLKLRIAKLGKTTLKPLVLSLASRIGQHPDCPGEIEALAKAGENLPSSLYRQWALLLAQGSPSTLVPSAFKGLADSSESKNFEKELSAFADAYSNKKRVRELVPTSIALGWHTDRLAGLVQQTDLPLSLNLGFLEQFFSENILALSPACASDTILRRALLEVLTVSWVYSTRTEVWEGPFWPFGKLTPEALQAPLVQLVAASTSSVHTDGVISSEDQLSWERILSAEGFAKKIQSSMELTSLMTLISEFMLQDRAYSVYFKSTRYEESREVLFKKLNTAFYQAPNVSALVPIPFNQYFLILQLQSLDLVQPELLGLLQANGYTFTKELHPWLLEYLMSLCRYRGIPLSIIVNKNLYGDEPYCILYTFANSSGIRFVNYINRLGS